MQFANFPSYCNTLQFLYKYKLWLVIRINKKCAEKRFCMYEFTKDCMLNIEQLDNEHKRLFQMINEAISLVEHTDDISTISKNLIANLKDYAATHFAHEEAYMESINDPELILQKQQHASFTAKVNDFVLDTSSKEAAKKCLSDFLGYLVRWLYKHILSSDMMIGKIKPTLENTDPFAFTDKYKTGIELVDDEHRHLFEIIKDTNDLIGEELLHDKYDPIMRLLSELKDYTELHFHDEEELMQRINYPEIETQKRERLVDINLEHLDEIDNNQQAYLLDLIQFLLSWLSNHILVADKKIGIYMKENNISE